MGDLFMGSTKQVGEAPLRTQEQQDFLSQAIGGQGAGAGQAFQEFLQQFDPEQFQSLFQQAFIDPAMQTFEQQVLPSIQQRFVDVNAGSSSALNQALGQSATDISTMLGTQMGQFYQGQQGNKLNALQILNQLASQQTMDPIIQQKEGILGPLIGAGAKMGAAGITASSKEVKENIKDYSNSIEDLEQLTVKTYDYIEKVGGQKDKVGLIAEDLPKELTLMKDGILHVDLYGLMGLMINSMKNLNDKLKAIEETV